ncbi:MAG: hypothetical protein LBB94_00035, partial [Clostridiales bacterium]|nr:hypothetical protein [Clostridiales bacterium]
MEKSIRPSKRIPRNRILKQLETFAATPDIRYGDSLRKVKEQYPRMLNSLRLPSEPADVRAAMIL